MPDVREQIRVLVVDDESAVRDAYRSILEPGAGRSDLDTMEIELFGGTPPALVRETWEVAYASQGQEARTIAEARTAAGQPFAVAFVDMRMPPGWDGVETIENLWGVDPGIQVVVATAFSDRRWDDIVARLGRADGLLLLKKPFDPSEVWQLCASLGEKWRLARIAARELAATRALSERLEATVADLEREVADRRAAQVRLHRHAYYDALTGLPNRTRLVERMERLLVRARDDAGQRFSVVSIGIDNFKSVRDCIGIDHADGLITEVGRRLAAAARTADVTPPLGDDAVSHLEGDEFVVVLPGVTRTADVQTAADRLLRAIGVSVELGDQQIELSACAGIALANEQTLGAKSLLRDAGAAMTRARTRRLRIAVYDPEMHRAAADRLRLESDMRRAISEHHFALAYQPIVNVASRRIVAVEALIRWQHPDYPSRAPSEFIALAEETGLIVPLGRWILDEACRALAELSERVGSARDLRMAVNLSRRQLVDTRLPADVRSILARHDLSADRLELELNESAVAAEDGSVLGQLRRLKETGVGLMIDDSGTGRSSLASLEDFPIDGVKIDGGFVRSLDDSRASRAIVASVVSIAHGLGHCVTAEGVETRDQYEAVRALGADRAQGFLLARPMPLDELADLLADDRSLSCHAAERAGAVTG